MKLKKRLAALAVSAVMVITMLPSAVFAHEGEYKIYKGSFTYYDNDTHSDEKGTFYYSDSYFAEPGTQLNEHLRSMSLAVAIGANTEKPSLLRELGFDNIVQHDMDTTCADTIGTTIASKKTADNKDLVVVALRGVGYGDEWISSLTVGASGDAEGFSSCAQKVCDRLAAYEKQYELKGAQIWITGFSRAGAVADMTGKLVNENLSEFGITENDLYDYAFAVPRASAINCGYKNIHDVVNSNDFIPRLMPAAWGIGRAGTQELFSIGNTTVQPKQLNIMGGDLISDKMVQDIDPETGKYGPLHPADPISTAEHLDKLADLLGKNITRENFDSAREVLPPFVSELVQGAIHGGSELMTFIKNTFAGITKDMTALQYILTLLAANEDSEEYQDALTAFNYIIAEKIESSPDKDKLSPELVKLTKDALPVVIKVFLPALRYDFKMNQGETLVTLIGNASDIIYNHYPSTYYRNLIKYDSYYTEKVDVDAGTMRYFGKEYSGSDPDTIRQLNLLDADKDIELLKNGYDVEYKMTYAGIYDSDITPEDRAAVETAIGAKPDIDIFVNTYITRSQTFGTAERIELDGTVEASFKCLPSETERLYHNGNYYFVYYKDGKAQIADATFTLRDDGILAVEYKSIARGNYALCYVSTAPKESMRIYGQNRYETSEKAADQLLKEQGSDKFKAVIVASGKDYPDALSAAYLAKVKDAPVLLTDDNRLLETIFYIYAHCDMGTDVYVIGGEGAVSGKLDKLLTSMADKPMNVIRLAGQNRYQTNIEVLKAAGVTNEQLLIASGASFADAISASAVGKPLLLAAASGLTKEQTDYLATLPTEKATIIGGTAAVTQKVENQLKGIFKTTERIGGKNRYETSANIAKKFFVKSFTVVLAYGGSFPDGLSGAPLAMRYEAPIVLVADTNYSYAKKYAESADAKKTVTFGGTPLISDKTVTSIVPE